jgi:hypothetical protein
MVLMRASRLASDMNSRHALPGINGNDETEVSGWKDEQYGIAGLVKREGTRKSGRYVLA